MSIRNQIFQGFFIICFSFGFGFYYSIFILLYFIMLSFFMILHSKNFLNSLQTNGWKSKENELVTWCGISDLIYL